MPGSAHQRQLSWVSSLGQNARHTVGNRLGCFPGNSQEDLLPQGMEEVPTEATQDGIWEEVGIVQRVGSEAADRSGSRRNHGPELTTETWPHAFQVPDWPLGRASIPQ